MRRAVELIIPLSLLVVEDGEGEGAGEGLLAAEEPLRLEAVDSSNKGRWCDLRELMAAAA